MSLLCVSQVFFVQRGDHPKSQSDHHTEHSRLTERMARAFCLALCPHLKLLKEDGMAKLGLRVTLDSQQVTVPLNEHTGLEPFKCQEIKPSGSGIFQIVHHLTLIVVVILECLKCELLEEVISHVNSDRI